MQSLIAQLDQKQLSALTPQLMPQLLSGMSNLLGPVGFVSVLGQIPGIGSLLSPSSELGALASALLPPGFLPTAAAKTTASQTTQSQGTAQSASSGQSAQQTPPQAPQQTPQQAPSPSLAGTSPPGGAPQPGTTLQGQPSSPPSGVGSAAGSGQTDGSAAPTESQLNTLLTLGGLMRNQWQLGMPNMGQVLPGLLPKGLLAELIPGGASPSSQNGTQNGTQNTSQTQSLQGTTPPQLPNGAGPQASPNPNGAMPSGPPATPSSPTTPSNPASPSSPSAPSQNGSSSASTDDGGIDDAVNYAFQSTFTALGPLGVAAQGALKLLRPDASFWAAPWIC